MPLFNGAVVRHQNKWLSDTSVRFNTLFMLHMWQSTNIFFRLLATRISWLLHRDVWGPFPICCLFEISQTMVTGNSLLSRKIVMLQWFSLIWILTLLFNGATVGHQNKWHSDNRELQYFVRASCNWGISESGQRWDRVVWCDYQTHVMLWLWSFLGILISDPRSCHSGSMQINCDMPLVNILVTLW